jgi:hypothetical protein
MAQRYLYPRGQARTAHEILGCVAMAARVCSVAGFHCQEGADSRVPRVIDRAVVCARQVTGGMGPPVTEVSAQMKGTMARVGPHGRDYVAHTRQRGC